MGKKGTCDVCEAEGVELSRSDCFGIETMSCADPQEYEPCTERAYAHGCSCHIPFASPVALEPPDPKVDKFCPLHGKYPDGDDGSDRAYDEWRDMKLMAGADDG